MSDLSELFSRDPLKLTDQNLDEIIAEMRTARKNYLKGNKSAGAKKNTAPSKPSLADLGF